MSVLMESNKSDDGVSLTHKLNSEIKKKSTKCLLVCSLISCLDAQKLNKVEMDRNKRDGLKMGPS